MKLLLSLFSHVYSRVKLFVFAKNSSRRHSIFMCFNYGLEEKISKSEVIFAVCRLPLTSCLISLIAGNLLRSSDTCIQINRHIGLLFNERLDTLFTSSDWKISGFTRSHVMGLVADIFFSTLESGFIFFRIRCRIYRIWVNGSRIRKEKVTFSSRAAILVSRR